MNDNDDRGFIASFRECEPGIDSIAAAGIDTYPLTVPW